MQYDPVLFDLDGTLIDSGALILASFRHATATVLGRTIPDEVLMANVGGHGIEAQMREFDAAHTDELVRVYREHNMSVYRGVESFEGIEPLLDRLLGDERRVGIVTVKGRATVEVTLEVLPFLGRVHTIVTGDDTTRHKPHPEPLLLALERLGAGPQRAVYVGDSPFDLRAAKAAGMAAIAVGWGNIHPLERLLPHEPDHVVHDPRELLDVL